MVLKSEGFFLPLMVEVPHSMKQTAGDLVYALPRLNSSYSGTQLDLISQALGTDFHFIAREGKNKKEKFDPYIPGFTIWLAPYEITFGTCFQLTDEDIQREIEQIEILAPVPVNISA